MKIQKYLLEKLKKFVGWVLTPSPSHPKPAEKEIPREEPSSKKPVVDSLACPYCGAQTYVRRGFRMKKYEKIQLYLCQNCHKTFTPQPTLSGKHYPLSVIFNGLSLYNLGYSLEEVCRQLNVAGGTVGASTLSSWLFEFAEYTKYKRMREFAVKLIPPKEAVVTATLAHQQLYRYRFHRAKCHLMIQEEYIHRRFKPLQEFLEFVPTECPHQYFSPPEADKRDFLRASESPLTFSKRQMIVRPKHNYAVELCAFVLQGSKDRKQRHNDIQNFFLYNDSVTVATEVPVYLTKEDLEHLQTQLGFEIYPKKTSDGASDLACNFPKLITGHIDIVQIRNGQIHILDYKPNAAKEQPIDQLTLYAMALSRLTGLRLFEFKCAWFDEKDYFEFYPLHVLHKPLKTSRRRKIKTIDGEFKVNQRDDKME